MYKFSVCCLLFGLLNITTLYAVPTVAFEVVYGGKCESPNTLTFVNKSKGVKNFVWIIKLRAEVIATFTEANPLPYNLTETGLYTILLKGTTEDWENTVSKDLYVKQLLTPLPTIITPNNDGKNDTFVTNRIGYKLEVYNRWGEIVYKSKNYRDDWAGNVPDGTYMYSFTSPNGDKCMGTITITK